MSAKTPEFDVLPKPFVKSNSTGLGTSIQPGLNPILDSLSNPLTVTIMCDGNPVEVGLMDDGSGNASSINEDDRTNPDSLMTIQFYRDAVLVSSQQFYNQNNVSV